MTRRGASAAAAPEPPNDPGPRPWLERLGLAAIAIVMTSLFGFVAVAAFTGGEWILAAIAAVGALMTLAVGLQTVVRG